MIKIRSQLPRESSVLDVKTARPLLQVPKTNVLKMITLLRVMLDVSQYKTQITVKNVIQSIEKLSRNMRELVCSWELVLE